MSPQGLSKSIHSLESELGVKLFAIDASGDLSPTPYADELLAFTEVVETNYALLQEAFHRISSHEKRELNVGVCIGILGYLGPDFVTRFSERHPHIRIRYEEVNDRECDQGLRRGDYDLILTVAPYPNDFIATELYRTPMCFWVSADDPLSQKDSLEIADFDGRNVAMPGKSFKCYDTIVSKCAAAGVEMNEVFTSAEIFRLFEYAKQGKGLGFSAEHLVNMPMYANDSSVVGLPLADTWWRFAVAYPASRALNEYERAFYDYCTHRLVTP